MAKFKKGQEVELPYMYPGPNVATILVETVNEVSGIVEEVKLIKEDGKTEVIEVSNVVVRAVTLLGKIVNFFARLFGKK